MIQPNEIICKVRQAKNMKQYGQAMLDSRSPFFSIRQSKLRFPRAKSKPVIHEQERLDNLPINLIKGLSDHWFGLFCHTPTARKTMTIKWMKSDEDGEYDKWLQLRSNNSAVSGTAKKYAEKMKLAHGEVDGLVEAYKKSHFNIAHMMKALFANTNAAVTRHKLFRNELVEVRGVKWDESVLRTFLKLMQYRKDLLFKGASVDELNSIDVFDFLYFSAKGSAKRVHGTSLWRELRNLLLIAHTKISLCESEGNEAVLYGVWEESIVKLLLPEGETDTREALNLLTDTLGNPSNNIKDLKNRLSGLNLRLDLVNCGIGKIQKICEKQGALDKYTGNVFSIPVPDGDYDMIDSRIFASFDAMRVHRGDPYQEKSINLTAFSARSGLLSELANDKRKVIFKRIAKIAPMFSPVTVMESEHLKFLMIRPSDKVFDFNSVMARQDYKEKYAALKQKLIKQPSLVVANTANSKSNLSVPSGLDNPASIDTKEKRAHRNEKERNNIGTYNTKGTSQGSHPVVLEKEKFSFDNLSNEQWQAIKKRHFGSFTKWMIKRDPDALNVKYIADALAELFSRKPLGELLRRGNLLTSHFCTYMSDTSQ